MPTRMPDVPRPLPPAAPTSERGSQTTEYALVVVVAATIAMLALAWARQGAIKSILDAVLDKVMTMFGMG